MSGVNQTQSKSQAEGTEVLYLAIQGSSNARTTTRLLDQDTHSAKTF